MEIEASNGKQDKILAAIHESLSKNDLRGVMKTVSSIETNLELDAIIQAFLLKYQYNFKTRFFEKAEFEDCLLFSNVLNRRIVVK